MISQLNGKKIVIFGGTGFIGSHLVSALCKESCQISIISRSYNHSKFFFASEPGQVSIKKISDFNQKNVEELLDGTDLVFNLIGILNENRKASFDYVHSEIPKIIARSAKKMNVSGFIHISALNVEKTKTSKYAKSKLDGELSIREIFANAIIVKPGVVFGKGDNFTNLFSKISRFTPFLPLIGTPGLSFSNNFLPRFDFKKKVKLQPLYVGDLVKFLIGVSLKKKKSYEIVGPFVRTFNEIFDIILATKKRKRIYIPLPFIVADTMALFTELLPNPILTKDQVKLLKIDSVSPEGLRNLLKFVKNPVSMEVRVSNYL